MRSELFALAALFSIQAANAAVVSDNTFGGAGVSHVGSTYFIPATAARVVGADLFDSFESFDLARGETAEFSGSAGIRNVVGRVTAGGASSIDGTIRSDIVGANFYLINPAGVVFGPDAALDITGSFAVTTADSIRLHGGPSFSAAGKNPIGPVLTTKSPASFGFLTPRKGASIQVIGSQLHVSQGQSISLVTDGPSSSNTITITKSATGNAAHLGAAAGRINLVAVSGPGALDLNASDPSSSLLFLTTPAKFIGRSGIEISGRSDVSVDGPIADPADPTSGSPSKSLAGGGQIVVNGSTLYLHFGELTAETFGGMTGKGIDINLTTLFKQDAKGGVFTDTSGTGTGGSISLVAPDVYVSAPGTSGNDEFGLISQTRGVIDGGLTPAGHGGDITVTATNIEMINAGVIDTQTSSEGGDGGNISVTAAGRFNIDGAGNDLLTGLSAGSTPSIYDPAKPLGDPSNPNNPPYLTTKTGQPLVLFNPGRAGRISVQAGTLSLSNGALIFSGTGELGKFGRGGSGTGGDIDILANAVILDDSPTAPRKDGFTRLAETQGGIRTDAQKKTSGDAGNISVDTQSLQILDGGTILARTAGAGVGGDVSINADTVSINGQATLPPTSPGAVGSLTISSISAATLGQGVYISGIPRPGGRGGDITVDADTLTMGAGGQISAMTTGSGAAGHIEVAAADLSLTGVEGALPGLNTAILGTVGPVALPAGGKPVSYPGIGGDVLIGTRAQPTQSLQLSHGATIATSTTGTGPAGNISIYADQIMETGASSIISDAGAAAGTGAAGSVTVSPGTQVTLLDNSILSTRSATGNAGALSVTFPGDKGVLVVDSGSVISSDAGLTGGNVTVTGSHMVLFMDGNLLSTAGSALGKDQSPGFDVGDGGALTIDAAEITLDSSRLDASARGRGGNIQVFGSQSYLQMDSQIESASGVGLPGIINVFDPVINFSGSLILLNSSPSSPGARLQNSCHLTAGTASSFVLEGSEGLMLDPSSYAPSWEAFLLSR